MFHFWFFVESGKLIEASSFFKQDIYKPRYLKSPKKYFIPNDVY